MLLSGLLIKCVLVQVRVDICQVCRSIFKFNESRVIIITSLPLCATYFENYYAGISTLLCDYKLRCCLGYHFL